MYLKYENNRVYLIQFPIILFYVFIYLFKILILAWKILKFD